MANANQANTQGKVNQPGSQQSGAQAQKQPQQKAQQPSQVDGKSGGAQDLNKAQQGYNKPQSEAKKI